LFSLILDKRNFNELSALFEVKPSVYWQTHYRFLKESRKKEYKLGKNAFNILVINTIVPFLFVYGQQQNKQEYKERALDFLLKLPPEKNAIIKKWEKLGIQSSNAYYTQALLQLKNEYCNIKRCLDCQIGNAIIKKSGHVKKNQ
jgi:hypothetical protein